MSSLFVITLLFVAFAWLTLKWVMAGEQWGELAVGGVFWASAFFLAILLTLGVSIPSLATMVRSLLVSTFGMLS